MNAGHPFPLIEDTFAHFIYNNSATSIHVAGDFNGWSSNENTMTRIDGTDFRYLTKVFETDARLDYKYVRNGSQWMLDPLNPNTCTGGYGPNSELSMGDYVQPIEIQYNETIPHGDVENFTFNSSILNNNRTIYVYTPPDYNNLPDAYFPVMIVNDGGEYLNLAKMDNILDYLISQQAIKNMIVVFVNPVNRNVEYDMNLEYANFIVTEIIPHIQEDYRTLTGPEDWGIMGASLGGLISVYISHLFPNVFGHCGSHSGYFPSAIQSLIEADMNVGTHYYLDWGTYENTIMETNSALLNILLDKDYIVETQEFHEGHSWGSWRAHTDNILTLFFPLETVSIKKNKVKIPNQILIKSIYPNPFNPVTTIRFDVGAASQTLSLRIYDITGQNVATLVNDHLELGTYEFNWDASGFASGIYFSELISGSNFHIQKMVLLK